eukprot:248407_1
MASTTPSYIWQWPSKTEHHNELLCHGFVRNHFSHFITPPVIMLISTFYTTDPYSVTDITKADIGTRFHGPVISINGFKFYFEFYPNGTKTNYSGQVAAFFCLASLPPTMVSIKVDFVFKLKEIEDETTESEDNIKSFVYDTVRYWQGIYSQTSKLKDVETLTFTLTIDQMIARSKDACKTPAILPAIDPITNPIRVLEPKYFLWEVTNTVSESLDMIHNAPNIYGFASPIFSIGGIKWYLTFYPNGSKIKRASYCNVYLHLAAVPRTSMKVSIRHSQGLQGDVQMRDARFMTVFDYDKDSWGLIERSTYTTIDLVKLNNFLCVAEIVMLDIYDNDEVFEWNDGVNRDEIQIEDKLRVLEYEWRLDELMIGDMKKDESKSERESKVFEMCRFRSSNGWVMVPQWKVILYPHGMDYERDDITICLELMAASLPKECTLCVRCTFNIMEVNARYITSGILDSDHLVINWGNDRILTKDIMDLEHCVIKIGMEIVDVYQDGKPITQENLSRRRAINT